jgi:hypothetical protein
LFGGGPSEAEKFEQQANIVLTLLGEQEETLESIARTLGEDLIKSLQGMAGLATQIGDKISGDEADAFVAAMGAAGITFTDLSDAASAFGIDISELMNVLINGEGDRKLAAEQLQALNEATGLVTPEIWAHIEALEAEAEAERLAAEAAQLVADALDELSQELGDISFDTQVFGLSLQEQFDRTLGLVIEQLAASGDEAFASATALLGSLVGIELDSAEAREAALDSIRAFVTAMGDDVPDSVKSAVLTMLGLLEGLARAEEDAVGQAARQIDPLEQERRKMQRALGRIERRESEIERELARLQRGLPGSAVGATQSVSITSIQANELLSVTRTNAFHNARTADAAESMQVAILEIAHAVGGDLLVQRISERLGSQYTDQLARQGVAA